MERTRSAIEYSEEAWRKGTEYRLTVARTYSSDYDALKDHLENILLAMEWCLSQGRDEWLIEFAFELDEYLFVRGDWDRDIFWLEKAAEGARKLKDKSAEATAQLNVARIYDPRLQRSMTKRAWLRPCMD